MSRPQTNSKSTGSRRGKEGEFRKFIKKTVDDILKISSLPTFKVYYIFHEDEVCDGDENTEASIGVEEEYQECTLETFKPLFEYYEEGDLDRITHILCHEIGHIHTAELGALTETPYKSKGEVRKANERLSTQIGIYLQRLLGDK